MTAKVVLGVHVATSATHRGCGFRRPSRRPLCFRRRAHVSTRVVGRTSRRVHRRGKLLTRAGKGRWARSTFRMGEQPVRVLRMLLGMATLVVVVSCGQGISPGGDGAASPSQTPGSTDPSAPSTRQQVVTFNVPTNGWRPGQVRMDSKVYGTLRFTDESCPFLEAPAAKRIWVAFPADATGVKSESGKRHVTDPDGHVYGTEGKLVDGAGGPVERDAVKDACHSGSESTYGFGFMDKPTGKVVDLTP